MAVININPNQFESIIRTILEREYPAQYFQLQQFYNDSNMQHVYKVTFRCGEGTWETTIPIADEVLAREEPRILTEIVFGRINELIEQIGELVTGKYPLTRIWADKHISGIVPLFLNPSQDVPGWVHNKFRDLNNFPTRPGRPEFDVPLFHENCKPSPVSTNFGPRINYNVKEIDMATATKKTVRRPTRRAIDPDKVKKPLCNIHQTPMEYDPVGVKWKCITVGCTQVARPKRDEDDRSVTVGKGGLQLRLIAQGDDLSVILISDDNIALDITKFVDINEIVDSWDAIEAAKTADSVGKKEFTIEVEHSLVLKRMRLTVMGADDLALMEN